MGLMNSSLQIGRNALLSYQSALQVIGSNISSVGSPDYTRLTPDLSPLQGSLLNEGLQPGAGVALSAIQRNIDEALEDRVRLAIGDSQSALTEQGALAQIESFFDDVSGAGVATSLNTFFTGFDELQNAPEDMAVRDLAILNGARMAGALQTLRGQLIGIGNDFDGQIADLVVQADEIATQVAELNERISISEAGSPGQATGLRDQRDALLRGLSEIFDVTVREQPNGAINVYLGNEALVQGNFSRGLVAVQQMDGEFARTTVRFADTNSEIISKGGRIVGLIKSRDVHAFGQIESIDTLALALLTEVNRLHADGQGLKAFDSITGSAAVLSTDVTLDSAAAGLAVSPSNGSFFITVADDATGTPVSYEIDIDLDGIDDDTTLESLVADFNETVTGVTASITSDNKLALTAGDGFSFTFGHDGLEARPDTSGVLAALGVNTFFTGSSAADIAVNEKLIADPSLLAASSVFLAGDATTAIAIAELANTAAVSLNGTSIPSFYRSIAGKVAVAGADANGAADATAAILSSLQAQKQSVSGVNLDEEAISLLKFERAFQGASRYISVVNDLLAQLIALIR